MKRCFCAILILLLLLPMLIGCNDADEELKRQIAEYRENKIEAYEKENERYADDEVEVAFLGDSLTDGYDLSLYYPQYLTCNRGIGGETTVGLEERLQVSLYDLKPRVAVMLIGANNMDTMLENYERILIGMRENVPSTRVILLSLTSMGGEWGRKNQLAAYNNVTIKLLAEKYSFAYVDLYSALLNLESGEICEEYTTDGGHLTPKGYEVLTAQITPVIERELALWNEERKNTERAAEEMLGAR